MPIYRDRKRGAFVFEFDRVIAGRCRIGLRKSLPKAWNKTQADAFDRQESARLYGLATGTQKPDHLIEDAVAHYVEERVPLLKSGKNVALELASMYWAYQGRPLSALADVTKSYKLKALKEDGVTPLAPATMRNRIRYLTSACRWGWREHGMADHDPAAGVSVPLYPMHGSITVAARTC